MATYFHENSDMQTADGLQTLVLMNPSYVQYSDTPPPPQSTGNLVFLNSAASSMNAQSLPHLSPQPQTQQLVGIPLQASAAQDPDAQHHIQTMHGFGLRGQYNNWNSVDPNMAARDTPRAHQGLSLSLSSQQPGQGSRAQGGTMAADNMRVSGRSSSSASGVSNGILSMLVSSKYLKAAQELLDEVVNVCGIMRSDEASKKDCNSQSKGVGKSSSVAGAGEGSGGGESSGKRTTELSVSERQETQMKKAKLITMLDEVEQRYRQYHQQMQIVISTFEQATGIGSAKTYTALALKTISKQFRCLKDAIMGQIRAANKSLGEEERLGGKFDGSRLKYVDHHLRQQRALQQLGMIQHNAWRPQRGLPERAVSVLRAWLFEHFLHPYPKDSDKIMLAKQTGLTRGQVSNWFINARVRLWKPMVEEMYTEEMKEHEQSGSENKECNKEHKENSASKPHAPQEQSSAIENQANTFNSKQDNSRIQRTSTIMTSMISASPVGVNLRNQSGFNLIRSSELEGMAQGSPKKQRSIDMVQSPNSMPSIGMDDKSLEANNEHQVPWKYDDERHGRDGYSMMGGPANFTTGFGQYPIGDLGRFGAEQFTPRFSGNSVSLTLGLPHTENLSMSGTHQNFLPNQNVPIGRRVDIGEPTEYGSINTSAPHSGANAFENIDIQNRKRLVAQLLPDFVAL